MAATPQQAPYGFARTLKQAYRGPDPFRVREQLQLLQGLWKDYGAEEFMFRFCWIQKKPTETGTKVTLPSGSKYWNRNLVPFLYNDIQRDIEKNLGQRNIFLKPRQAGYSTFNMLRRLFIPCILHPGENGLFISRNGKTAGDTFGMLKRCYKHFAEIDPFDKHKNDFAAELKQHLLHTAYSNRRELVFDQIDTAIRCDSAEDEEVGQSYTYTHVVADEVARWEHNPEATLANLKESIPSTGTLDLVSTANGFGNYFHAECMRARDTEHGYREFRYHFHTWFWHEEYRTEPAVDPESLTKEEQNLVMAHNLDMEQIAWRRKKKEELRHEFDEKYPEDDITCFALQGNQYFDKEILRHRYMELKTFTPIKVAISGKTVIFQNPRKHHNYIIGADVASGLQATEGDASTLDFSAAVVIDEATGEEVAAYRSQLIPEEFGWDLADLGKLYNNALIAVERNEDGGAVILTLEVACQYMNLYKHRDWWKKDWNRRQTGKSQLPGGGQFREILGFKTDKKSRPLALNRLRFFISENPERIWDRTFIEEALTFVRDEKGKPAAAPGAHDDTVMCRAIAHYVRNVRLGYLDPDAVPQTEKYGETPQEFNEEE